MLSNRIWDLEPAEVRPRDQQVRRRVVPSEQRRFLAAGVLGENRLDAGDGVDEDDLNSLKPVALAPGRKCTGSALSAAASVWVSTHAAGAAILRREQSGE